MPVHFIMHLFVLCAFLPWHDNTNKVTVRPAKTQISLGIHPVWSESSLCAHWVAKDPSFLRTDSEDSDQTGRMPRLIWIFAGRTLILLVLSWCGSYTIMCLWFSDRILYSDWLGMYIMLNSGLISLVGGYIESWYIKCLWSTIISMNSRIVWTRIHSSLYYGVLAKFEP